MAVERYGWKSDQEGGEGTKGEICHPNRLSAERKNPSGHVGKRGAFG
jgi:hypothetical protein